MTPEIRSPVRPDTLVLRSGWNPGDLFALVELHPTSGPAEPGGIMGLNRWGAPFTQIVTSNGASADLLVWFAARGDCRLEIVDRFEVDPRAEACPNQVRYVWEGTPRPGQQLVFTQVYYPHPPYRARATSSTPKPGSTVACCSLTAAFFGDPTRLDCGSTAEEDLADQIASTFFGTWRFGVGAEVGNSERVR